MGEGPRYRVPFRRRREGRTDYRRRLGLLRGEKTRLVVRRSLRNVTVQVVDFDDKGDVVRAKAESRELPTVGWNGYTENTPAAYLTGLLAARRASEAGVQEAVLDIGRQVPTRGGNLFAALAGALDGGLKVPHSPEVLPDGPRLRGEHLRKPEIPVAFDAARSKIFPGAPPLRQAPKKKEKKGAPAPAAPGKGGKPAQGAPKGPKPEKAGGKPAEAKPKPKKEEGA
ncbi:MAG: 50S ribosomal protein L18 [Thermoplasmatota archaeon]